MNERKIDIDMLVTVKLSCVLADRYSIEITTTETGPYIQDLYTAWLQMR